MSSRRWIQYVVVWVAAVGLCVPQLAFAAKPAGAQRPAILDITLHDGGAFLGQVVDAQGSPVVGMPVSLRDGNRPLAEARTNAQGFFAFQGLQPGVYQVATPAGAAVYRVWSPQAAPPSAKPGALLVSTGQTVRGQGLGFLGSYPLLTAALIATAIAVPIAVTIDRNPSSP